ncbi:HpyAIV family type II restriction enzyme [Mycoplasmopsis felifaucium]|uniref:HpyAIV family type II restriction enzyme n=1 Tax=Mycoplasmopsis felifaucium TaxID=35768 RepID=UPI00048805D5|nr:hypothetical protein [Mycoplasmopsis felifaucium]
MEYSEFETELKEILLNNNAKKLILKLVDAPYRYESILNPFSFKTKLEQSFLRTQENKYFNHIKDLAVSLFFKYGFDFIDSTFVINVLDPNYSDQSIQDIAKFNICFKSKDNKCYCILIRKRDTYSANETVALFDKFKHYSEIAFKKIDRDPKLTTILWFIDEEYRNNEEYYNKATTVTDTDNYNIKIKYGSELFDMFNQIEDWKQIESYLNRFKNENYTDFLKMPDLDKDEEALETLVSLSPSAWAKLNSDSNIYVQIRKIIFNQEDPNSNYFKALKHRTIIENFAEDEDKIKMEIMKLNNKNN